jgi:integrase/recombinase XerC
VVVGEEPLFARHDKASHSWAKIMPMTTNSMRVALNGIQERAGAQHFSPHQLRHKAATDLYGRTGDIYAVQEYLGHANVGTTAGTYTHLSKDRLIETVRGG